MTIENKGCLFCSWEDPSRHKIISHNEYAYARWDDFPEVPGHALVIPKYHREGYFDLSSDEVAAILALSKVTKMVIDREYSPDGYNVFTNVGRAAGQVMMHAHVHMIPRYDNDVPIVLGSHHR